MGLLEHEARVTGFETVDVMSLSDASGETTVIEITIVALLLLALKLHLIMQKTFTNYGSQFYLLQNTNF